MNDPKWIRVKYGDPCKICGKSGWCTYTDDGQVACCMRVQSGLPARNGGWIHRLADPPPGKERQIIRKAPEPARLDIEAMYATMLIATRPEKICELARNLGVDAAALAALGCAHQNNGTFAFPMKDAHGNVVGIRLRSMDGRKWAVEGSRAGLFYESEHLRGTVLITEGPTDAAAAMSLGFGAVGRPSCRGLEDMLKTLLSRNGDADFVLCPDKDSPGMEGAQVFAENARIPMRMLVPPAKDLREWLKQGATHDEVAENIQNSKWINVK